MSDMNVIYPACGGGLQLPHIVELIFHAPFSWCNVSRFVVHLDFNLDWPKNVKAVYKACSQVNSSL